MKNIYDRIDENRKTGEIEFFIKERKADCVISTMPIKEGILKTYFTISRTGRQQSKKLLEY